MHLSLWGALSFAQHRLEVAESRTGADVLIHQIQRSLILAENISTATAFITLIAKITLIKLVAA